MSKILKNMNLFNLLDLKQEQEMPTKVSYKQVILKQITTLNFSMNLEDLSIEHLQLRKILTMMK
jgi:hypothetical protein